MSGEKIRSGYDIFIDPGESGCMLDTKSLAASLILILVIGCALHVVNWRIHRGCPGVKWWAIGLMVHTLGLTLSLWENGLAVHDPRLVVGINSLSILGALLLAHGTARFSEHSLPPVVYIAVGVFAVGGLSWFSAIDNSITMRMTVFMLALEACYALTLSRLYFIARRDGGISVVVLGASLASTTVLMSVLIVQQLLTQPDLTSLYEHNPIISLGMLGLIASETTAMFGYLLLSAGHSQARLERLAHSDPLTDLPNRRAFEQEIAQRLASARKNDRLFALAIFDIDHFKQVNDKYGHDAGDAVLRHLSVIAAKAIRPRDFLARVGGEEFAVIFEVEDAAELVVAANRLRLAIEVERPRIGELEIAITVSVGAVLAESGPQLNFGILYRAADRALYQAKASGRNRVIVGEVEVMDMAA